MKKLLLNFVQSLKSLKAHPKITRSEEATWRKDPLSHPDIRAMSERARADLQFVPEAIDPE
jgi:hypothetical protein